MGLVSAKRWLGYVALAACSAAIFGCAPANQQKDASPVVTQAPPVLPTVATATFPNEEGAGAPAETRVSASHAADTNGILWIVVVLLSISVLAFAALTFWLFRWRRRLPDGQVSIVPEDLIKLTQDLARANLAHIGASENALAGLKSEYSEIQRGFSVFSNAAALKDAEIDRLRKGGDRQTYLQFVRRFVRVLRLAEADILEDRAIGRDTGALESIRNHLRDALLDCGLESFSPGPGEDYRDRIDVAESPRANVTSDRQKDWTIAKVVHAGFRMPTADTSVVIEPAVVEIFRHSV